MFCFTGTLSLDPRLAEWIHSKMTRGLLLVLLVLYQVTTAQAQKYSPGIFSNRFTLQIPVLNFWYSISSIVTTRLFAIVTRTS